MKPNEPYPVEARASALHDGDVDLQLDVEIESRASRSLLVVDEVRRVLWNSVTRTVEIWLADRPQPGDDGGLCRAVSLPNTRELAAGARMTVAVRVPRDLWRLTPRADGSATVDHADLTQALAAIVHLSVADTPFYPRRDGPPAREQMAAWGQLLTVTARR
jgi:hypothetical protein